MSLRPQNRKKSDKIFNKIFHEFVNLDINAALGQSNILPNPKCIGMCFLFPEIRFQRGVALDLMGA